MESAKRSDSVGTKQIKAIIGPHAGLDFSGPTGAWAYINIDPSKYTRVILMGPSHYAYLDNCALSKMTSYKTPIKDLPVDTATVEALAYTGKFGEMTKKQDEQEHSLEMHLPFIARVFKGHTVKLVPILVGNLTKAKEKEYGKILAPFFEDKETLFIISSDFCHWGEDFDYMPHNKKEFGN